MRISYGSVNQVGIYQGSGFHYELLDFIIDVYMLHVIWDCGVWLVIWLNIA